jgi:hypothetical protein
VSNELSQRQEQCRQLEDGLKASRQEKAAMGEEIQHLQLRYEQFQKEKEHEVVFLKTKLEREIKGLNRLLEIEQEERQSLLSLKQNELN